MTEYREIPDRSRRPPSNLPPPRVSRTVPPDSQPSRRASDPTPGSPLTQRDDIRRMAKVPERKKSGRRRILAGVVGVAGLAALGVGVTAQRILSGSSPEITPPATAGTQSKNPVQLIPLPSVDQIRPAVGTNTPLAVDTNMPLPPTFVAQAVPATQTPRKIDVATPRPTEIPRPTASPTEIPPPWALPPRS